MRIEAARLEPAQAAIAEAFQYLISNTDYSFIAAPPGETCCHNAILLQGDDAVIPAGVVLRRPVADGDGFVGDERIGVGAGPHGRQVDEGLERGAGLAQRLGGAVELALAIIDAAHHGEHPAVGPHGHQCRLAGPHAASGALQRLLHGALGDLLQRGLVAGAHGQRRDLAVRFTLG